MDAAKLASLLGRPLTPLEVTNRELYLKIAKQSLQGLLCTDLCGDGSPKVYDIREGYSTVFTDIFTDLDLVTIDGTVIDSSKYSKRQWNKRSGNWFNSIVFKERFTSQKEIEVLASWGFDSYPDDLQLVLAGLFDLITKKNNLNPAVTSKQVEDFKITFSTGVDLDEEFSTKYGNTLDKYSLCNVGYVKHGGC